MEVTRKGEKRGEWPHHEVKSDRGRQIPQVDSF